MEEILKEVEKKQKNTYDDFEDSKSESSSDNETTFPKKIMCSGKGKIINKTY